MSNPVMRFLGDIVSRAGLAERMGQTYTAERDLYKSLGYRVTPTFDDYLSYYTRGDIGAKIIDVPPKATWRHAPEIRSDNETFVEQVEQLDKRLRLFHYLKRVDEISGIGQFAVLLIGTRGGLVTQEPTGNSPEDVIYFSVYHQGSTEITEYVEATDDERYGLPLVYEIDLTGTTLGGGSGKKANKQKIPWQRIIHVAENPIEDDVFGQPRIARVLNRLDDLNKLMGGAAELYWQNIGGVWHADLSPDVEVGAGDLEQFEDDMLAARHGISRLIQTRGVTLSTVAGIPTDPSGTYEGLRQIISAAAEIPERVLFGSERGQLAGDQDQKEWQARVASRQEQHAEPGILRQTLDRLIAIGILDDPGEYEVEWPPLDSPSTEDRADTAQKFSDAISKVAPEGATDLIMPAWEFREIVLGLDPIPPPIPEGYAEATGFEPDDGGADDGPVGEVPEEEEPEEDEDG